MKEIPTVYKAHKITSPRLPCRGAPCRVRRPDAPLPPTAAQNLRKDLSYRPCHRLPCRGAGLAKPRLRVCFAFAQSYAVGADIIRPRSLHKYLDPHVNGSSGSPTPTTDLVQNYHTAIGSPAGEHLAGCGDSTHRCRRRRHKIFAKIYPTDRSGGYHPPAKSAQIY